MNIETKILLRETIFRFETMNYVEKAERIILMIEDAKKVDSDYYLVSEYYKNYKDGQQIFLRIYDKWIQTLDKQIMKTKDIEKLAEKEAGAAENWITEDDRQHFIDGYVKGFQKNLEQVNELIKLHHAILENKSFEVDRKNKIIKIKD